MLHIQVSTPSPDPSRPVSAAPANLADLSRNASVISSSSSSSAASGTEIINTPRPRPVRQWSSPRSRSPNEPKVRSTSRPPAYLTRELGVAGHEREGEPRPASRGPSRTRNSSAGRRPSAKDFEFGDILGEGSYSTVMRAVYPNNGNEYAVKVIDKNHLKRNNKMQTALAEKDALVRLGAGHPGIVRLHWSFHDEWSLYFVLDLAKNGELQTRISRLGSLSLQCARYYAAQIVDAVGYMHSKGVIHRDLKPENLLLDDAMRIKITDFGTGKIIEPGAEPRAQTFVGTAQYVSPELLEANTTSRSSDLWAIGCIVFQMISGRFPFHGLSEYLTWQKIKRLEYSFPDEFDPVARDLVEHLLVLNPEERLGAGAPGTANDMDALKRHPFFSTIEWGNLWTLPAPPIEAGLVQREQPTHSELDGTWDYAGAAWDDIVSGRPDDEMSWASDDEELNSDGEPSQRIDGHNHYQEVGPRGEIPTYGQIPIPTIASPPEEVPPVHISPPDRLTAAQIADPLEVFSSTAIPLGGSPSAPISIQQQFDGYSIGGSTTSSSEGSPVDRLGAAVEALELNRGRATAISPIQGNGPADLNHGWYQVLRQGEHIVFNSKVEVNARKRRLTASRLFPIAVQATSRKKTRHLILTNQRLVCLKQKKGRTVVVKSEVPLIAQVAESTKLSYHVEGADIVGEADFIVKTTGKSQTYSCEGTALATLWVNQIRTAINAEGPVLEHQLLSVAATTSTSPQQKTSKKKNRSASGTRP